MKNCIYRLKFRLNLEFLDIVRSDFRLPFFWKNIIVTLSNKWIKLEFYGAQLDNEHIVEFSLFKFQISKPIFFHICPIWLIWKWVESTNSSADFGVQYRFLAHIWKILLSFKYRFSLFFKNLLIFEGTFRLNCTAFLSANCWTCISLNYGRMFQVN